MIFTIDTKNPQHLLALLAIYVARIQLEDVGTYTEQDLRRTVRDVAWKMLSLHGEELIRLAKHRFNDNKEGVAKSKAAITALDEECSNST